MSVGKASIKRAASAESKKTAAAPRAAKKTAGKTEVKKSVLTPSNSQELQAVFLKKKSGEDRNGSHGPVRITEELPDYLL